MIGGHDPAPASTFELVGQAAMRDSPPLGDGLEWLVGPEIDVCEMGSAPPPLLGPWKARSDESATRGMIDPCCEDEPHGSER